MKKSLNEDCKHFLNSEAFFKDIKSLAFDLALERVKQSRSELSDHLELRTLLNEAKVYSDACLDFGNKILGLGEYEVYDEGLELNGEDFAENLEFDDLMSEVMSQAKLKQEAFLCTERLKKDLNECIEDNKRKNKSIENVEEVIKGHEKMLEKVNRKNRELIGLKGRLGLKEEAIMKIRFKEVSKADFGPILKMIEDEKTSIEELNLRFNDLSSQLVDLVKENKSLLGACQELGALVDNYPNVKDQRQRLCQIEEKMNQTSLVNRNLDASLAKVKSKNKSFEKVLECELMKAADCYSQVQSLKSQINQKIADSKKLTFFEVSHT